MFFTEHDLEQIADRGMTPAHVLDQLEAFKRGFPFVALDRPCTPGDGIVVLKKDDCNRYGRIYQKAVLNSRIVKFVPASGAGSRMFEQLLAVRNKNGSITRASLELLKNDDEDARYCLEFLRRINRFAFYDRLREVMGPALDTSLRDGRYSPVLDVLLTEEGLGYPNLPKGLLPFHRYSDHVRTPFEEHLVEAVGYTLDRHNIARVHFTVSPEHLESARQHIASIRNRYESMEITLDITWSTQRAETDTIAADTDNRPFRDQDGRIVFRAGGHGALLDNLNEIPGDIIFIKNIDNIVPDHLKAPIYFYKRVLGGYLVDIQTHIFNYVERLSTGDLDRRARDEIIDYAVDMLGISFPPSFRRQPSDARISILLDRLNRPVRVCGIVKNTGEPGGGPFWVRGKDGDTRLQIVESAQVDMQSEAQRMIFQASTHFNPVDLVCGVRDFTGKPFDLRLYRDSETGFISLKSKDGRPLKAMELPGLWNGSMAFWTTVFVEVPEWTFNPVKRIDDLLGPAHQPDSTA